MNPTNHSPAGAILFLPVHLTEQFRRHRLVVRSSDPHSFPKYLKGEGSERIEYIQLTDLEADPSPLVKWAKIFPIDLVMTVPVREYPRLYAFAPLLDRGPVRISIPVAEGMEKAVRLAASLHFSIKIIPQQPDVDQVKQLIRLTDFYLRNPTIEEPIEFFHSLFLGIVNSEVITLWEILEKTPARYGFVTDDGRIVDSQNCPITNAEMNPETGSEKNSDTATIRHSSRQRVMSRLKECGECPYRQWCRGFFKYPAPDYSCAKVFPLFQHVFAAAAEFKNDLAESISGAPP
jgi:hypothetical protein